MQPGPITSSCSPESRDEPNGFCVRLSQVIGGHSSTIERDFFFGDAVSAENEARTHYKYHMMVADGGDLEPGIYHLSLHEAWRGSRDEPHEYKEDELSSITFRIEKKIIVTIIQEQ